ncbi:hypothetical protein EON82_12565 [bacterium]|nr:MAG: hypothetical protein EON82_12565 [bacterium]
MDENLVMLVHRELKGWSRVRVEAHLFICPACRAKERRLRSLSTSLAVSLSNPSLGARTFVRPKTALWASLGAGVASVLLLGWNFAEGQISPVTTSNPTSAAHCDNSRPPIPPPVPTTHARATVAPKPLVGSPVRDCDR